MAITTRTFITVGLLLVAILYPVLQSRVRVLWTSFNNRPAVLDRRHAPFNFHVEFADLLRNCEDAAIDEENAWAILSCDPTRDIWNTVMGLFTPHEKSQGTLYLYDYAGANKATEPVSELQLLDFPLARRNDFHPLGLDYHSPSQRLFVINHAQAGFSIEIFKLLTHETSLTHIKTITHPSLVAPNSIIALSDHEFYFTNDHTFALRNSTVLAMAETYLITNTGNVQYFDTRANTAKKVATLPFANGLAMPNSTTLAVASTNSMTLQIFSIDTATHELTIRDRVALNFMPDNLSTDSEGTVLISGHGNIMAFDKVMRTRAFCNSAEGKGSDKCKNITSPSFVAEYKDASEEREGSLKELYVDDAFSTTTAAFRDKKRGKAFAMGVYERGLLVWEEAKV